MYFLVGFVGGWMFEMLYAHMVPHGVDSVSDSTPTACHPPPQGVASPCPFGLASRSSRD